MKLEKMAHIGVPMQNLQLEYPKQNYLPFSSAASPNEPVRANLRAIITEIFKKKLRLGAKVFRRTRTEKIFEHHFSVKEGEKLLKASQCYISTSTGPILGFLFISTNKITFCSEKPMMFYSKNGSFTKFHYKVNIPVGKISKVIENRNVKNLSQKYIEVVTLDDYNFWFLGFLSYRETLEYLQQSIF